MFFLAGLMKKRRKKFRRSIDTVQVACAGSTGLRCTDSCEFSKGKARSAANPCPKLPMCVPNHAFKVPKVTAGMHFGIALQCQSVYRLSAT
ncbi:MAG: hypothetical protein KA752_11080 [Giesbergeria sp.]|nr:hypothetical protein [Giesbergeria sp.]